MRKLKLNLLLVAALVFSANVLNAQEGAMSFTLQEAQDYALKNGYQVRLANLDEEKAKQKVKETTSIGLPQINGKVDYMNNLDIPLVGVPGEFAQMPDKDIVPVEFGVEQSMTASVTASQLIFDGSYLVGLQAAKVYVELSKNDKQKSEIEIKNLVTQAYGNAIVAERNAEILKSNKENIDKILFETVELFNNGFAEEQDKDQLELLLSNTVNAYEQSVRQIAVNKNQLKFILGIPIENSIELKDQLKTMTAISNSQEFVAKEFDVSNHIDFKSILTQERASELLVKQQQSNYLPSLNAFYTYQRNSFSEDFNFFGGSEWNNGQFFGVNLNIPIFTSFANKNRVQQTKIDYEKVQITKIQIEEQLKVQADNAKSEYMFAFNQYETMNRNLALAERIFDKVKAKYDEGISSSLELTQANNQLLETQGSFINASFQLINAKVNLDKALNNY
jgi:outer membrane protein TolC